jgi:hypothetical protein
MAYAMKERIEISQEVELRYSKPYPFATLTKNAWSLMALKGV